MDRRFGKGHFCPWERKGFRNWNLSAGLFGLIFSDPETFYWLWLRTTGIPFWWGLVHSPPILEPILVVGLGCSLGIRFGYTLGLHPWEMAQNGPKQHFRDKSKPKWGHFTVGVISGRNTRTLRISLPEFMNFKLFGKTILVANIKFGLFLGHPLSR